MKRVVLAIAMVVAFGIGVSAAVIPCTDGTNDVNNLNPEGCSLGGLLFTNFSVSDNDPGAVFVIGINGVLSGGDDNVLRFTVAPAYSVGGVDVILIYQVNILYGVDLELGTASGMPSVTEVVCAVEPEAGICPAGQIITTLGVNPGSPYDEIRFPGAVVGPWIIKDVSIPVGAQMSDFANSHAIPEPVTLSLIGAGLFAIGLLRRRLKK